MAVSAAEFLVEYPEFVGAPTALVEAKISDATQRTDAAVWGQHYRIGVMLRAAQLLARSPHGRKMQLMMKDGSTVYDADLRNLVNQKALGGRVL